MSNSKKRNPEILAMDFYLPYRIDDDYARKDHELRRRGFQMNMGTELKNAYCVWIYKLMFTQYI